MDQEKILYASYAAMDRVPALFGIPLKPGVVVFTPTLIGTLVSMFIWGPGGLLCVVPGAGILAVMRFACRDDDQALRIIWLELLCFLRRTNAGLFGGTYTLAPMRYGRTWGGVRQMLARSPSLDMQERFICKFEAELAMEKEALANERHA